MSSSLEKAIRQLENVEANLVKMEHLWDEMASRVSSAFNKRANDEDRDAYEDKARFFLEIASNMPAINGYKMPIDFMEYSDVFIESVEASECGELDALIHTQEKVFSQGGHLKEYRFKLENKRKELIRSRVLELLNTIEKLLGDLNLLHKRRHQNTKINDDRWTKMESIASEIDVLLGSTITRPDEWSNLYRHLHFGQKKDLDDITNTDFPGIKNFLEKALYGEYDPLPVSCKDLSEITAGRPFGEVSAKINWRVLTAESFERLIYELVRGAPGYENVQWLMHTNAPDSGRDISADKICRDDLTGLLKQRIIIQCKKSQGKGINDGDVASLCTQIEQWEPPRIDVLIIATTGRFSKDAVKYIEKANQSDRALRIEMWPDSHLESLVAKRPDLIAKFGLR